MSDKEPAQPKHSDNKSLLILIRRPRASDGRAIWDLQVPDGRSRTAIVQEAVPALTTRFADTSLVAEIGGELVAFVGAHRPASLQPALIVWQIDVAPDVRQRGLGSALLHALIQCPGCAGIEYVEATVHQSNAAGRRLFESFARDLRTGCEVNAGVASSRHGDTDLLRIGPIRIENAMKLEKPHEAL